MKKILFISQCLPPYLYPQSIQIGRFLAHIKKNYDAYIVCADENTVPDPTLYPGLFDGIDTDKILHIQHRQNAYINFAKNRLLPLASKNPDLYRAWSRDAHQKIIASFGTVKFDAILTFSFPLSLNLLGRDLKSFFNCPWIAHQSDPWADNPFMHYGPLTRPLNQRMENKCFTAADRLVFTCAEARDFFRAKYPALSTKISHIDHSFDASLFPPSTLNAPGAKIIRYVGGFYGSRTARPLLDVLSSLSVSARKNLKFEIVGGNAKTRILVEKSGLSPDLISVTGRVNYAQSLAIMRASDVLLVIDAPLRTDNIFFPSKLVDYIAARRPIIGISTPGPTSRILKSFGYPCFAHDKTADLRSALERIAAGDLPRVADDETLYDNYNTAINTRKLSNLIEEL